MAKITRFDAIYARQSVDKKDSVSIEAQIDDCKAICGNSPKIYKDKGFSGKNTDRPELQQLINDIKRGIIKRVVVYKLDRISRNITDFYQLHRIMELNDCEFASRNESFDTSTSMGRGMMGILAVFAQMERENTQMRIVDNYQYRITTGVWASGKAPFGFKNDKINGATTLTPIPEEIEVVKWMFKIYASEPTISLGQIQKRLIEQGFKGKQSTKGFSRTTINHILTNPIYCAADELLYKYYQKKLIEFVNDADMWNGEYSACIVGKNGRSLNNEDLSGIKVYVTNVAPVIDSRTFIMVQNRLAQNKQIASDNKPNNALQELSGLLKCASCGSAIKMQARPTLTCNGRNQKRICDVSFKGIKLEQVQMNVGLKIQEYLANMHKTQQEKRKAQAKLQKEIAELEKQLDNLIDLAQISDGVEDSVKRRINNLTIAIKEKQLKLKLDNEEDLITLRCGGLSSSQALFDKSGNILINYMDLDTTRKQAILHILVKRILVHSDGSVDIEWIE